MSEETYKQTSAHDWLADCAEYYVAYLFAHAGFEVFGSAKWGSDLAIHNKDDGRWWRVEVRSTDRDKRPIRKAVSKLKDKAEILAEVKFIGYKIDIRLFKLKDGKKTESIRNPGFAEITKFILIK